MYAYAKTGADQLRGNHAADQHIFFGHINSTNPLLPNSEISSVKQISVAIISVAIQLGLCLAW